MTAKSVKKSVAKKSPAKKKTARKSAAKKSSETNVKPGNSVAKKNSPKKKTIKKNQKQTAGSTSAGMKISLNAVLAINDAKTLYAELNGALESKKDISIDASSVEMVDTAVLQMLLAFIKKTQINSVAVSWINPSKDFINRSETLNLTEMLGLKGAKV